MRGRAGCGQVAETVGYNGRVKKACNYLLLVEPRSPSPPTQDRGREEGEDEAQDASGNIEAVSLGSSPSSESS